MKTRLSRAFALGLVLGSPAFVSDNLARAQDTPAPAPKPAEAVRAADTYTNLILADYAAARAVPEVTSADRLLLANARSLLARHSGTAACAACHTPPPAAVEGQAETKGREVWTEELTGVIDQLVTQRAQNPREANFTWVTNTLADQAGAGLDATFQPLDDSVRTQLGLAPKSGFLVASLVEEGAAAKAGLKANDILLSLAETPLAEPTDLPKQLKAVGEKDAPLKILRAGKPMTLRVRPVARMTLGPAEPEKVSYFIGVSASPPDDVLRAHVQLPEGQGLLVTEVVPESPAEKVGVKKYDILLKLNDTPLDRTETLSAQVQTVAGKPVPLLLLRSGQSITYKVKPEPRKVAAETSPGTFYLWSAENAYHNANGLRFYQTNPVFSTRTIHSDFKVTSPKSATTQAKGAQSTPSDLSAKRVEELETEIKALREAIESLRDSIKKGK